MSCDEERRPVAEFMRESIIFCSTWLRVRCRREESSRSLSHLLVSFLLPTTQPIGMFLPGDVGASEHCPMTSPPLVCVT